MNKSYNLVKEFMKKYPLTIAWRIKKHCDILEKHLNSGEKILYAFAGQKNESSAELFNTYVVALTNKRIIVATKRVLFGYFFKSITPDLYNDLTIHKGIIWGRVSIDTVNELITITNIDARALDDVETNISEIMLEHKKSFKMKSTEK